MRNFLLGLFSGLTLLILLMLAGVIAIGVQALRGTRPETPDNVVLRLSWSDPLPGHQVDPLQSGLYGSLTLTSLIETLDRAATDERVRAVVIDGNAPMAGEFLWELQPAIERLRDAGKPIEAYLEMADDRQLSLAVVADRVTMSPASSAGLVFAGMAAANYYMRPMLDRYGIKMHVLHQGEAKGFGEHYVRDEMSDAVRGNLGLLVEDLWALRLDWLARHRPGVNASELRDVVEDPANVILLPQKAHELGLVDNLLSRAAWQESMELRFPDAKWISVESYLSQGVGMDAVVGEHVAVLWAEGAIVPSKSGRGTGQISARDLIEDLQELREDEDVRAIVLRVESPGGSALASEEIYCKLEEIRSEKPLLISMGRVAASGGYYISAPGQQIWASPATITGSIGVVSVIPDLSKAADKLGVQPDGVYTTPLSTMSRLGNPVPRELLQSLEHYMAGTYTEFRDRVTRYRPLSDEELLPIAGGRVWSGERALELGLVDSLGTLEDVIQRAAWQAELAEATAVHYPKVESLMDLLLSGEFKPKDFLPMGNLELELLQDPEIEQLVENLQSGEMRPDPSSIVQARCPWIFE